MIANSLAYQQAVKVVRDKLKKYEEVFTAVPAQIDGARFCRDLLSHIDSLLDGALETPVPLQQAAENSGYSVDHLRRLIHDGLLPTYREGRKHLVLLSEVPTRMRGARSAQRSVVSATAPRELAALTESVPTPAPMVEEQSGLAPLATPAYDPVADARSVLARVRGGEV